MAVSRAAIVEANFKRLVAEHPAAPPRTDLDAPVREGTALTARTALALFEAQIESRILDLLARELKSEGRSYYTIGSSGHEGNAAVASVLDPDDMAFLHYRSGAFYCARAAAIPGAHGPLDVLLGIVASRDEAIAGGRHKVFGSVELKIPPQTSTIASHLPKALGYAVALDRAARLRGERAHGIAVCTFGDASSNHASAVTAFNAAAWSAYQNVPAPVLFVCEDNGLGISVRTPEGWIAHRHRQGTGLHYFAGDGLDLPSAYDAARQAVHYVRTQRKPAFLHLRTVRLLGHAGSDVEQLYRDDAEIEATEAADPVLATARLLLDGGWIQPHELAALYDDTRRRLRALADEALRRPSLTTRAEVMAPLATHEPSTVRAHLRTAPEEVRRDAFRDRLPEQAPRRRHLAIQLNRALLDTLLAHRNALIFGEDVARKGGVYHVTAGLVNQVGVGRVFNTLLDETSILGMAIGAAHAGLLPIPEIQYLAYLMNAIDQLRGEAGSMRFFSNGQYHNGMVVRVAGLAYQRGFGGHFHNDNGIAPLREIPGLLLGCPSRGDDAVRMLRTMVAAATAHGRVCVLLEPIALYMTRDLYEEGDGGWLTDYPEPGEHLPVGEIEVYGEGTDLCIMSYANGLWMSLRVARRLEAQGIRCRVVDLRWLLPLPLEAAVAQARACERVLVVDECRASSGIADALAAGLHAEIPGLRLASVVGADSYIPLGEAANLVLIQEPEIEAAALSLVGEPAQRAVEAS